MISRYDIVQGTPEWHEIRWGKIGGTLSSGLFKKTDTLFIKLLAEHCEVFEFDEDSYFSNDMLRGIELEPEARRQLSEYCGVEFLAAGWLQCEENSLLGISPDGISKDETIMCEIKCPARAKHTRTILEGEIPDDNIEQCIHNFVVNPKLEKLYFCSFRPESIKPLFVKVLTPDSPVDLGTKAKPVIKTVREWVEVAKNEALALGIAIKLNVEKLKF